MLRHARAGELWFLKQQPGPAAKPSKGKGAPKSSTEEDLARDEEKALKSLALSVSDACLRCVRALDPPPDPDPCERSRKTTRAFRTGKGPFFLRAFFYTRFFFARVRVRSSLTSPAVPHHRRSRADAESRASPLTLVAPLPVRNVAYGLGDAASWESAWQQHKFVLELAGKHSARDSASRGVALSRLKDLCAAEGYPPIDSAKAHNVVNCMVAAGLLGKREAYVKDGRDRGASTSVVCLARYAPADAAAAAAAAGETRMVSDGELAVLAEALRSALERSTATQGVMTDRQLARVLDETLRSESGAFQWSARDTSVPAKMNKLFARAREWLVQRGVAACAKAHTTVTDAKTGKTRLVTMDALRLTSATLAGAESAPSPSRLGAPETDDALDGSRGDEARVSAREPLLKPVGGKSMQLETRVEDSLVSLCAAAGEAGVCVPDVARAFGFAVKPFGKRVADMYERNRAAFGVEARTKREGKSATTWMYRQGCAGRPGGAGASAGAAEKKRARAALVLGEARRRGYLFRRSIGRWLRDEEARRLRVRDPSAVGPKEDAYGPKIIGPIVDLLVDSGDLRRETVYKTAPYTMLARSVTDAFARSAQDAREVLFERGFPKPTDAIKRAIGEEAARMELAEHSRRRDPAASTPAAAAVEVDQSAYISKKTAIRSYRENEGAREDASARVRGAAASVVTATPPNTPEEGERLRRSTRHARDVAALTGGVLDAAATRARAAHAFFASEAFGGLETTRSADSETTLFRSNALDLAALFQRRAPLALALLLLGCDCDALRSAPAETAARLAAKAASGARLGELSEEDQRVVLGASPEDRDTHLSKPLGKILSFLCVCELTSISESDLPGGRRALRWSLARRARFERVDDDGAAHEETFDVTSEKGVAAYWDGLERAFKPPLVWVDEPVKTKGTPAITKEGEIKTRRVLRKKEKHEKALDAFPNAAYVASRSAEGGATLGLCYSKCWSRVRDVPFPARVALLEGFEAFRLRAYAAKLAEAAEPAPASGEARARAAAKLSVLSEWVLPELVVTELATIDGLGDKKRVRKAWDDDQTRLLNELFEDGSVTKTEIEEAHPDEKAKLRNDGYAKQLEPAPGSKKRGRDVLPDAAASRAVETAAIVRLGNDRERSEWSLEEDDALLTTIARRTILGEGPEIDKRTESYGDVVEGRSGTQTLGRFRRLVGKHDAPTPMDTRRGEDLFGVIEGFRARRNNPSSATETSSSMWEREGFWCAENEAALVREVRRILVTYPKSSINAYYASPLLGRELFGGVKPENAPKHGGGAVAGREYPKRDAARGSRKREREDARRTSSDISDDDVPISALGRRRKKKPRNARTRSVPDDAPVAFYVDSASESASETSESDSDAETNDERLPGLRDHLRDPERAARLAGAHAALVAALAKQGDAFFDDPGGLDRLREAHGDAADRAVRTLTDEKLLETRRGETRPRVTRAFRLRRAEEDAEGTGNDAEGARERGAPEPAALSEARALALLAAAARGDARLRVEDGETLETSETLENLPVDEISETGFKRLRVTVDAARGGGALAEIQAGDADAARAARAASARAAAAAAETIPVDSAAAIAAARAAGVRGVSASELAESLGGAVSAFACERTLQAAADAGALRAVNAYDVVRFADPSSAPAGDAGALPWRDAAGAVDAALLAQFKRFAFDVCCAFPGSDVGALAAQMHPTLAPVAGVALVELMLKSGELATRATSAPAEADGAPPAALAREETRAAQARAERTEAPRRHVFPPEDSGKFPFGSSGDYAFPRVVTG